MGGGSADVRLDGQGDISGRPQEVHGVDPRDDGRNQGKHHHRVALVPLLVQMLQDGVIGLIPRDFLPHGVNTHALLRVGALQGHGDAVGIIELHDTRHALAAQMAPACGAAIVAFDLHQLAVHHMPQDAASVKTAVALGGQPLSFIGTADCGTDVWLGRIGRRLAGLSPASAQSCGACDSRSGHTCSLHEVTPGHRHGVPANGNLLNPSGFHVLHYLSPLRSTVTTGYSPLPQAVTSANPASSLATSSRVLCGPKLTR